MDIFRALNKRAIPSDCVDESIGCVLRNLSPLGGHHEHVYPLSDGIGGTDGGPITITTDAEDDTHAAGTDQWYWGATGVMIPATTITSEWVWIGNYVYATTTNKAVQVHMYKTDPAYMATLDTAGATPAEGSTELLVSDGSIFQADDLIWITSVAYPNGEIQKIVSVSTNTITFAREGDECACTGLRWPHNDATTTKFYRCWRDADGFHGQEVEYSAGSAKDFFQYRWHTPVLMAANAGLIARAMNQSDGTTVTVDVKSIYED